MLYDTVLGDYGSPERIICKVCGKIIELPYYREDPEWLGEMAERSLCYECLYWTDIIEHPDPHGYVINHQYFTFPPAKAGDDDIRHILAFDGHQFNSSRIYNHGIIPERFWPELPNNAHFISKKLARVINENIGHNCQKKGCWDRTHCLWYHGPMDWNEIPKKHKEGGEGCPIYINRINPNKSKL